MKRAFWRLVAHLILFSSPGVAFGDESGISKGPYIQAPRADTVSVLWETSSEESGVVHFGVGGRLDQTVRAVSRQMKGVSTVSRTNVTNIFYKAEFSNLKPGARYSYSDQIGEIPGEARRTFDRSFASAARPNAVTRAATPGSGPMPRPARRDKGQK